MPDFLICETEVLGICCGVAADACSAGLSGLFFTDQETEG